MSLTRSEHDKGYRLAWGIYRELTEVPPYSFDKEQEKLAAVLLAKERGMTNA